jgi:hypothetical protein
MFPFTEVSIKIQDIAKDLALLFTRIDCSQASLAVVLEPGDIVSFAGDVVPFEGGLKHGEVGLTTGRRKSCADVP